MTEIAIIRCEKNLDTCPLKGCIKSLINAKATFSEYAKSSPSGILTCHCPGNNAVELASILKSKGAEVIHFCTYTFASKTSDGLSDKDGGFCENIDSIIERVSREADIRCIEGTAHLPKGYVPLVFETESDKARRDNYARTQINN